MAKKNKIKVGISCGDVNGIGLEIILKTFSDNRMFEICTPVLYSHKETTLQYKKSLNANDISLNFVANAEKANARKLNLVNVESPAVKLELGNSTEQGGKLSYLSLEAATNDLAANKIDVLVTAPINKNNIQSEDFKFPGHTEYLASLSGGAEPLMLLVANNLRVGVATGHIPISKVAEKLTQELIVEKLDIMNKAIMSDFGVIAPKIAVLGLNPHAGDNGLIGEEEQEIISPAIKKAKENKILAFGPFPSDGFFGSEALDKFDGVLAMYHDQGLIPFKTIAFEDGVNFTAGLPIVRTSPDHGTAYDIAGKGEASEVSFRNAVYLACDVYKNRKLYKEMNSNPLKVKTEVKK